MSELPILEARDLSVQHRAAGSPTSAALEAVSQVSLSVMAGEIVAIVGESGCGKSSLARAMVGLLPASGGEIQFRGKAVASLDNQARKHWRRDIQLLFQDPHSALSPRRRIVQNLSEALQVQGLKTGPEMQQRILAALADVGLSEDILQRYPHQLSGGQKQRAALARALLCQPSLIIADEPLSALDVSEQARLLNLFRKLRTEKRIAFILIAHDLAVVQQLADRVLVMYLGQFLEQAPAQRFFAAAAHPYSQALLKASQRNWEFSPACEPVLPGEPPSALTPPSGCVFHTRCVKRLEHCSQTQPGQHLIAGTDTRPGTHLVKCHLYTINE